jgi:hypothetical protein
MYHISIKVNRYLKKFEIFISEKKTVGYLAQQVDYEAEIKFIIIS